MRPLQGLAPEGSRVPSLALEELWRCRSAERLDDECVGMCGCMCVCMQGCERETGGSRGSPLTDLMSKYRCQEVHTCVCVCSRNSIPMAGVHLCPWCLHVQEAAAGETGIPGRL